MSPVPELDLDAIRARAEAATRGPWTVGVGWCDNGYEWYVPVNSPGTSEEDPHQPDRVALIRYMADGFQCPHADARMDAEFIAAARQDVPALIAEVERLRTLVDERTAPAGPADDERVWLSVPRRGTDMHALVPGNSAATGCGRSRSAGGITVLAAEAVQGWACKPCKRCWPGAS